MVEKMIYFWLEISTLTETMKIVQQGVCIFPILKYIFYEYLIENEKHEWH